MDSILISFIFISLCSGTFICLKKNAPSYIKPFPFFLLATICVELTALLLFYKKISNTILYNIFTSCEFIFYFYILRLIIKNKKAKKIILTCLFIFPFLCAYEIIFVMKHDGFHSITYALGCLIIVSMCVYYFLELFQLPQSIDLKREPAFWICSGLLFYYTCSFPLFAFVNYLNNLPVFVAKNLSLLVSLTNYLLYTSFTISFLCRLKTSNFSA